MTSTHTSSAYIYCISLSLYTCMYVCTCIEVFLTSFPMLPCLCSIPVYFCSRCIRGQVLGHVNGEVCIWVSLNSILLHSPSLHTTLNSKTYDSFPLLYKHYPPTHWPLRHIHSMYIHSHTCMYTRVYVHLLFNYSFYLFNLSL